MTRELVFVHGRSQENKDASALKKQWIDALGAGVAKSRLSLPIPETQIRLPYYFCMSTAEPTPAPASASFGPVGERKGSVPSGDERLSPYLVPVARAVTLPAPRVLGRADCAPRSVA